MREGDLWIDLTWAPLRLRSSKATNRKTSTEPTNLQVAVERTIAITHKMFFLDPGGLAAGLGISSLHDSLRQVRGVSIFIVRQLQRFLDRC